MPLSTDNGSSVKLFRRGKPVLADNDAGNCGGSDPSRAGVNSGYPRLESRRRWGSFLAAVAVDKPEELSPAVGGDCILLLYLAAENQCPLSGRGVPQTDEFPTHESRYTGVMEWRARSGRGN